MSNDFTRRDFFMAAGVAGTLAASLPFLTGRSPAYAGTTPPLSGTLRERADNKRLYCGSAVGAQSLSDAALQDVLRKDANILVPENELKWSRVQPTQHGPLEFEPAESIYAFAVANGMVMRGHNLTWSFNEPEWAQQLVPTLSASAAGDLLTKSITDIVSHWRGRLVQWDVINEPIDATDKLQEKLFSKLLGEQYMDLALEATKATDPHALRMMNQTLIEQDWFWEDRQRNATLRLVERLLKRGAPLQGFGIESHLRTLYPFSETKWRAFLDEIQGFGLKILITEFDVNDSGTLGGIPERDAASAALATAYLDVTLSYPNCLGMLVWGETDRYDWQSKISNKQRKDSQALRPHPRDVDYGRKPLWNAIATALDKAPIHWA